MLLMYRLTNWLAKTLEELQFRLASTCRSEHGGSLLTQSRRTPLAPTQLSSFINLELIVIIRNLIIINTLYTINVCPSSREHSLVPYHHVSPSHVFQSALQRWLLDLSPSSQKVR